MELFELKKAIIDFLMKKVDGEIIIFLWKP